jgi:hypothetical protein
VRPRKHLCVLLDSSLAAVMYYCARLLFSFLLDLRRAG